MVAEVVPEDKRVESGALLYTAAPLGLFLATFVNHQVAAVWMADAPESSWRVVFLFGLIPAALAFVVRMFVKEPERWKSLKDKVAPASIRDLFAPDVISITVRGTLMAIVALIAWWSCNAFIPTISSGLAQTAAAKAGLDRGATLALVESWKTTATIWFNLGGLLGTLLTIPVAKHMGRKPMYAIYFAASAVAIFAAFGLDWPPEIRLRLYFFIGLSVFGVFGSFTFYLPELFPTRIRGTGSGFCYNIGRVFASAGPFIVGAVAARGVDHAMTAIAWVAMVPAVGLLLVPFITETRGRPLAD
jgi:hypothetical protein